MHMFHLKIWENNTYKLMGNFFLKIKFSRKKRSLLSPLEEESSLLLEKIMHACLPPSLSPKHAIS